ncbi:MAG: reverse transcriptase family protein [Oscillospiraceae bacterium]
MKESKFISKRMYTLENTAIFKSRLTCYDWSEVVALDGTNNKFNLFLSIVKNLHTECFPLIRIKINPKSESKPWITKTILNSIRKKNTMYKQYLKTRSDVQLIKYKKYKNKLQEIIRQAEKRYYSSKILESKDNLSKTWKVLNSLINKKQVRRKIGPIEVNGVVIENQEAIANNFNNYFANVGSNLAKQIPASCRKPADYLQNPTSNSMFFAPATDQETIEVITNLKYTNSLGNDNIPSLVIRDCKYELAYILTHIINNAMNEGVFPDLLKTAKIVPIFKSDNAKLINNYRPISILTTFSKIFEKITFTRLSNFMNKNQILHENQFGFRGGLSTCTALLQLINELTNSIDKKQITIGVFIDLAKAFDTVDHRILLQKLEHYGIRGIVLNWFTSYLSNRRQYVIVDGVASALADIKCGVPQGSILGPILFLLYINDLALVSNKVKNIMFADDTNLFLTGNSIEYIEEQLNYELAAVNVWFQSNLLSLNIKKTSYIIFGHRRDFNPQISMNNILLERQTHTKFLGVILSANLKWSKHIDVVVNKISKNIGIISKVRHLLPQHLTRNLYFTQVYPYISYCNLVWASPLKTTQLERIFKKQKTYCRLLTFSSYDEHSRPLFIKLSILNVYEVHKYQLLTHVYKTHNKITTNIYSQKYYNINSDIHCYNTRQKNNMHIPICRTSTRRNTIAYQGPKLWNTLPEDMRSSPSINIFQNKVKKLLMLL